MQKKGNTQYINEVIYLLLIDQDEKQHYIYIKILDYYQIPLLFER